ncbi:hypothetical protein [Vulgatibacter incomptus]|uniref:4Fe-4S ferredoxin-type domain-containing protein n=1 Tax=Vulgatibacter incomptus TaxID=1391653 RepID=A0A0K1PFJ2_9BACT|nr:hypothetical protein [Vulgatibacter incomptus]AKU92298.1 hypothetical protein AKJ08_2685 [Vulgatibacter incomptus]
MNTSTRTLFFLSALAAALAVAGCSDGAAVCKAPDLVCGDTCVDPNVDPNNCGGCGIACGGNFVCSDGACVCPSGKTDCEGRCVDTRSDSRNCGGCGVVCEAGTFCLDGACGCSGDDCACDGDDCACEGDDCGCPGEICGDVCTNTSSDELNCGGCGIACGNGQHCLAGICASGNLYAACFHTGQVVPFLKDTNQRSGGVAQGIGGPQSLALLGDRYVVSVGSSDSKLYVFDRATMHLMSSMLLAETGSQMPDQVIMKGNRAVVVNSGVNTVQVVDLSNPAAPKSVYEVSTGEGTNPIAAAFDEKGTLWVTLWLTGEVIPVELGQNAGVAGTPIALPKPEGNAFPSGVAVVGDTVYAALNNLGGDWNPAGNGRLATVSIATGETGMIDLGPTCTNAGFAVVDGHKVLVACTGTYGQANGEVAVYDTDAGTVEHLPTGGAPARLSVDPHKPGFFYVADSAGLSYLAFDADKEMAAIQACVEFCPWDEVSCEFVADVLVAP